MNTCLWCLMLDHFAAWWPSVPGSVARPRLGEMVHSALSENLPRSNESLRPGRGGARPVSGPRVQPGLSPAHFKYFLDGIWEHSAVLQTHKAENLIMFLDCKISWTDPDVRDTCHVSCKIVNVPQCYIPWQTVVSHDTWVLVDSVHKWRVCLAFGWNMVRFGKLNAARMNWNLEKLWNQRVYLNHGKYFVNYFSDIDWHFYS